MINSTQTSSSLETQHSIVTIAQRGSSRSRSPGRSPGRSPVRSFRRKSRSPIRSPKGQV